MLIMVTTDGEENGFIQTSQNQRKSQKLCQVEIMQ